MENKKKQIKIEIDESVGQGEYSNFAPWSQVAFLADSFEYVAKKGFNLGMRNQLRELKFIFFPFFINLCNSTRFLTNIFKKYMKRCIKFDQNHQNQAI